MLPAVIRRSLASDRPVRRLPVDRFLGLARGGALRLRTALAITAATMLVVVGCGGDDDAGDTSITREVAPQLAYLDPQSSLVAAIDLRYEERNWERLRPLASRVLRAYEEGQQRDQGFSLPPNIEGTLARLASFAGLSFEDDVRPVLDGRLVVGLRLPPREPLPRELAQVQRLLRGAIFDPSRQVFVRPTRRPFTPPVPRSRAAPSPPPPTSPPPPPPPATPPVRPSPTTPPRVPGRVVRLPGGRPLKREHVMRYQRAIFERSQATRPRALLVYRSPGGEIRKLARRILRGDRLRPVPGHEDAAMFGSGLAVVGDDTLLMANGPEAQSEVMRALDRRDRGRGFEKRRLAAAERDAGFADPLILATGDLTLARAVVEERNLRRAREGTPYLRAVRRLSGALELRKREAAAVVRVVTDGARLRERDLPLGPSGSIALPKSRGIVGASRDQSRTTTFAAGVVRKLFADSRFVRAVERTERRLDIRFEDEVLRQFDCPSASVFLPPRPAIVAPPAQRFSARSCVRDPRRMRNLLPRLAPHLPRILTAMQGLGDEGLLGLLLVAPDAPLTPSALAELAQIVVRPFDGKDSGRARERLYEVDGLRSNTTTRLAQAGPDRVVFGMIGDDFVVGSDRRMARSAAKLPTETIDQRAASALRVPVSSLLVLGPSERLGQALADVFDDVLVTFTATPQATTGHATVRYKP